MFLSNIIIIIAIISSFIICATIAYERGKKTFDNKLVLPDIGFDCVEDRRNNEYLYKFKEIIFVVYLLLFFLSIMQNKNAVQEYFITIGLLLILKNILFATTVLPDPTQKCVMFSLTNPLRGSCYDLVISSHGILLFSSLFVAINNNIYNTYQTIGSVSIVTAIIYMILSLRQHYTIDIINALAYSFFVNYYVKNTFMTT